ncbi:hypothetical protein LZ30DRAFT_256308 [Colletotrichum cereale]|nr:hypothetical protein LZ30DRAFT_256308 [Colletotrichum cereale]
MSTHMSNSTAPSSVVALSLLLRPNLLLIIADISIQRWRESTNRHDNSSPSTPIRAFAPLAGQGHDMTASYFFPSVHPTGRIGNGGQWRGSSGLTNHTETDKQALRCHLDPSSSPSVHHPTTTNRRLPPSTFFPTRTEVLKWILTSTACDQQTVRNRHPILHHPFPIFQ